MEKNNFNLFIFAGEDSGDLLGYSLIQEIQKINPNIKISAVAGPRMRKEKVFSFLKMEDFQVIGFIDVIFALPKLIKNFFFIRKKILKTNPKACIFIDYPGFNLRMQKSLRKKKYRGKLIHYVCPTVWAWGKKRIDLMKNTLDLLLTIFPFEKKYFSHTNLNVEYVGHPLVSKINFQKKQNEKTYLGLFPGSRTKEIIRNLPLQLKVIKRLSQTHKNLKIAISLSKKELILPLIEKNFADESIDYFVFDDTQKYEVMNQIDFAIATSGTITLELALHNVLTVVTYKIKMLDLFILQNIIKIDLPFYSIVNIILNKPVFPELFGPNLSENRLFYWINALMIDDTLKKTSLDNLKELKAHLTNNNANKIAALKIVQVL